MRTEHHASSAFAAAAYTSFTSAVTVVRLRGDRAITRFNRSRIVQGCGLITLAGTVLVVLAPGAPIAFTGWTVIGAGLALLAPTILGAASLATPSSSPGTAIAAVTTLGYLGSFSGPPLIGALAGLLTLSVAVGLLAVAAAAAALLGPAALTPPR